MTNALQSAACLKRALGTADAEEAQESARVTQDGSVQPVMSRSVHWGLQDYPSKSHAIQFAGTAYLQRIMRLAMTETCCRMTAVAALVPLSAAGSARSVVVQAYVVTVCEREMKSAMTSTKLPEMDVAQNAL